MGICFLSYAGTDIFCFDSVNRLNPRKKGLLPGLPNFPRAMAIRLRALVNKNSMV